MRLTYRGLEDLLAEMHDVAPQNRVALQGRIKHFQRNGWPGGTNTGKGKAASYDFGAVLKLCLGFELLQIGVTPERAAKLLKKNWYNIRTATSLAINAHPELTTLVKDDNGGFDVFLFCDPKSLSSLTDAEEDPTDDTFFYTSAPEMARQLTDSKRLEWRRLALINLTIVLDSIAHYSGDFAGLRTAYLDWDDAERAADDEEYKAEFGVYPRDHGPRVDIEAAIRRREHD
ncbi:hypothetical protein [Sphingomonas sp. Leaf208]|uniref:hypothetical protein n=1 Tax=Sphingomonas sp. Leaf208 TaxID=1735679 RepID=UPI000B24DF51|nr:hypothetical protein [Sphingomonas sp. Leaf208]